MSDEIWPVVDEAIQANYLISFSSRSDCLSQWSMYADNCCGIAMKFSINNEFKDHILQVNYFDHADLLSKMKEYTREFLERFYKSTKDIDLNDPRVNLDFPHELVDLLLEVSPYVKSDFYQDEREVRFSKNFHNAADFKVSNDKIVPYVSLPIHGKVIVFTLSEVMIGPRSRVTMKFLKEYLSREGFDNVLVTQSSGKII